MRGSNWIKARIINRRMVGDTQYVDLGLFNDDNTPLLNPYGLKYKTVVIPHSKILALWSQSVDLVPPTEQLDYEDKAPTELPMPVHCHVIGVGGGDSNNASDYGNQNAGQHLMLTWGASDSIISRSVKEQFNPPFTVNIDGADHITTQEFMVVEQVAFTPPHNGFTTVSAVFPSFISAAGSSFNGQFEHNGLSLDFSTPSHQNLTGGHPDDKLIVFLTYYVAKFN
jgi:hypothetical protein